MTDSSEQPPEPAEPVHRRQHLAHLGANLGEFEKENAAPTFKRGYGFHPLCSFVDHGAAGTGEPLAIMLRPGNAGSNTAADHITVTRDALRQLPFTAKGGRIGRKVLIRTDAAGGTHEFVSWLHARKLGFSLGFTLPDDAVERIARIPKQA